MRAWRAAGRGEIAIVDVVRRLRHDVDPAQIERVAEQGGKNDRQRQDKERATGRKLARIDTIAARAAFDGRARLFALCRASRQRPLGPRLSALGDGAKLEWQAHC